MKEYYSHLLKHLIIAKLLLNLELNTVKIVNWNDFVLYIAEYTVNNMKHVDFGETFADNSNNLKHRLYKVVLSELFAKGVGLTESFVESSDIICTEILDQVKTVMRIHGNLVK